MSPRQQTRHPGGSLGTFADDLIRSLGGKPTKQARQLFNAWQRWEGGWSNNAAAYNPFNLTAPGSGFPTINSVGVVRMPSYDVGVQRTADLIASKYPAIASAFRSGQIDFTNPQLQANLNMWLSGKAAPGMSPYVSKIARSYGANVPAGAVPLTPPGGVPTPPSPLSPQAPTFQTEFDPQIFKSKIRDAFISGGGRMDLMQLPGMRQQSFVTKMLQPPPGVSTPATATGAGPVPGGQTDQPVLTGKGIALPINYKSTHVTDGLTKEGFTRAIDIMGAPGTPVRSPMEGTVLYFHPDGAQGGGSMEVRFADGRVGWIGHIANGLPAGAKVRAGTQLAVISSDHPRPHVHWDLR